MREHPAFVWQLAHPAIVRVVEIGDPIRLRPRRFWPDQLLDAKPGVAQFPELAVLNEDEQGPHCTQQRLRSRDVIARLGEG